MADIFKEEMILYPEKQVIFRSTPPQHFDGGGVYPPGYFQEDIPGQKCLNKPFRKQFHANICLREVSQKYGFKYLDSAPLYMDRYDMHFPDSYKTDCSHFCYTPEVIIPEIALLNTLLWQGGSCLLVSCLSVSLKSFFLLQTMLHCLFGENTKKHQIAKTRGLQQCTSIPRKQVLHAAIPFLTTKCKLKEKKNIEKVVLPFSSLYGSFSSLHDQTHIIPEFDSGSQLGNVVFQHQKNNVLQSVRPLAMKAHSL